MNRQQMLQLIIAGVLIIISLVGCEMAGPGPIVEVPASTPTSEQSTATLTPVPSTSTSLPEPLTATATPTPTRLTEMPTSVAAHPQPGATLRGDLVNNEATGSGTITLKVSEDGASIAEISLAGTDGSFTSLTCSNGSTSSMGEVSFSGLFLIAEGKLDIPLAAGGNLKGQFTSPTDASGTLQLVVEIPAILNSPAHSCDFGSWDWSAEVQ